MPAVLAQHPIYGLIRMRGLTIRQLAEVIGMNELVASRMMRGLEPASPRFRRSVAAYLELPEKVLFADDAR
jgi:transcriptional regulator with XRE-family HTH domain